MKDRHIRRLLEQLEEYRPADFLQQTESVENRLLRFFSSDVLRRSMGLGPNALDFDSILEQGHVLLVNLGQSEFLSAEQARLIGILIIIGFFEAAMRRKTGSRPYYLFVDEAHLFVLPEIAQALDQCRKKGLHLVLSAHHLAQFKAEDYKLYKSIKNNCRTKLVFATPDRQDALELADDLFVGLAEPELKYMHRRLAHLIEDVRETSTTISRGFGRSIGQGRTLSHTTGSSEGGSQGKSQGQSESKTVGDSFGRTFTRGRSNQIADSESHTTGEHESHTSGFSETNTRQRGSSSSSGESTSFRKENDGFLSGFEAEGRSTTSGESSNESESYSRTDTGSDSFERSESFTTGRTKTTGWNRSLAVSRTSESSSGQGTSSGSSQDQNWSNSRSLGKGRSWSREKSQSVSRAETDQPGTRHHPFLEEDPEFWRLEEQRWKAAELLMRQPVGHCVINSLGRVGQLVIPTPRQFYIEPKRLLEFMRKLHEQHSVPWKEADRRIAERQAKLLAEVFEFAAGEHPASTDKSPTKPKPSTTVPLKPIWTVGPQEASLVQNTRPSPKRGPRPDYDSHEKAARIVEAFGSDWTQADKLEAICEQLDQAGVPIPKTWPNRSDAKARTWQRACMEYSHLVKKAIKHHVRSAHKQQQLPLE